jgi:hypothetical protein
LGNKSNKINKKHAIFIAKNAMISQKLNPVNYKSDKTFYIEEKGLWVITFYEKGYFLVVGNQVTVLVNENTGKSYLHKNCGFLHPLTKKNLEQVINASQKNLD